MIKTYIVRGKVNKEVATILIDDDKDASTIIDMIENFMGEPFDILHRITCSSFIIDTDLQ